MKIELLSDGAPECPFVRIFDFDQREACELAVTFNALARKDIMTTLLGSPGQMQVQLVVGDAVADVTTAYVANTLIWTGSVADWQDAADLTAPFCDSVSGGFQWLNDKGIPVLLSVDGKW